MARAALTNRKTATKPICHQQPDRPQGVVSSFLDAAKPGQGWDKATKATKATGNTPLDLVLPQGL
jgi:hypothetical protein